MSEGFNLYPKMLEASYSQSQSIAKANIFGCDLPERHSYSYEESLLGHLGHGPDLFRKQTMGQTDAALAVGLCPLLGTARPRAYSTYRLSYISLASASRRTWPSPSLHTSMHHSSLLGGYYFMHSEASSLLMIYPRPHPRGKG